MIPSLKFSAGQALAERYIREALDAWRELVVMYFRFTFVALVIVTACMLFLPVGGVQRALAAGDATEASCPNESLVGFSAVLAECRGYEMVTPPYKAGEEPGVTAISPDGSSVLTPSFGTYAGRENSSGTKGLPYLVSRSVGWGSFALSPPSSEFPAQQYWGATSDLSRSLWRLRSLAEPVTGEDLYLREADGEFVKVGSLVPPADQTGPSAGDDVHFFGATNVTYQDASSDLSHVLFEIEKKGQLWPFDTTIANVSHHGSLYEYAGVEQRQPSLVGVSDGKTVLNGFVSNGSGNGDKPINEVLPAGHLISDCQTTLGSEEEDGYNAMSTDGNTVFFTAVGVEAGTPSKSAECRGEIGEAFVEGLYAPGVSEVYARLGGAQTVPISEPTAAQCVACQVGEVERPAEFVGASEDGSKAFFITEQELFAGDVGKNLFEYDFRAPAGDHVLQVSADAGPGSRVAAGLESADVLGVARISEDGSHAYFVAEGALTTNANQYGRVAEPNQPNLYVFIRDSAHPLGEIVFITPLIRRDKKDWSLGDSNHKVEATPDGQYLAFASFANVAAAGPAMEGTSEVFEYDSEPGHPDMPGELVQVSVPEAGFAQGAVNAEGIESEMPHQEYITSSGTLGPTQAGLSLAISSDGSMVVFTSKAALTRTAEEETGEAVLAGPRERNVYLFHSTGGVLSTGKVGLVAAKASSLVGLDASGDDVFFKTAVPLLSSDGDGAVDVYDARVDGGVPFVPRPVPCVGEEACLGSPVVPPVLPGVGGSAVATGGNVVGAPKAVSKSPPKSRSVTDAEKLSKALRTCRVKAKKQARAACEKQAHRTYAAKSKAEKPGDKGTKGGK